MNANDNHRDGNKELKIGLPAQPETPPAPPAPPLNTITPPDNSAWEGKGIGPKLIVTTFYVPPEKK